MVGTKILPEFLRASETIANGRVAMVYRPHCSRTLRPWTCGFNVAWPTGRRPTTFSMCVGRRWFFQKVACGACTGGGVQLPVRFALGGRYQSGLLGRQQKFGTKGIPNIVGHEIPTALHGIRLRSEFFALRLGGAGSRLHIVSRWPQTMETLARNELWGGRAQHSSGLHKPSLITYLRYTPLHSAFEG